MKEDTRVYKALAKKEILKEQRLLLENLSRERQQKLYFRAYQILDEMDRRESRGKFSPVIPPGISELVWWTFPVNLRSSLNINGEGCHSTMGEFFYKVHKALTQASLELEKEK